MDLVALLREFGADADLIALAERWVASRDDTPPDGATLTDDEISTLLSGLIALGADDEAGVGLISAAADTAVALRGEQATRTADAEAEEAQIAAERARLNGETAGGTDPDADPETPPADPDADPDAPPADPDAPPAEGDPVVPPEDRPVTADDENVPVTAAGGRASIADLARRRRPAQPAVPEDVTDRPTLVFSADVPNVAPGLSIPADRAGITRVSEALQRRFESFGRTGRRRGKSSDDGVEDFLTVATLEMAYPEDRRLVDDDGHLLASSQMARRVARVMEQHATPQAIAAAGGFCAFFQPFYGVETIGDTNQPVRDEALVSFEASRGGIMSMAPPILPQLAGSIGVWTEADDITAASDATHVKAIIDVECGEPRQTQIRAVTARLRYGNFLNATFKEWTQAWADLQMVAMARVSEVEYLADIEAGSTTINLVTTDVSAVRDTVNTLARAAAGIRSRHRAWSTPMRAILPEIWLTIAAEDIAKALPGGNIDDNLVVATARILAWFRARNINVTFSPDMNVIGPQGDGTALAALPPTISWALYPEGTWLGLGIPGIDMGVVRDTSTNAVNNFETFSETFQAAHKLGIESYWGTLNVCPSGAVRGTLDPTGKCASYT